MVNLRIISLCGGLALTAGCVDKRTPMHEDETDAGGGAAACVEVQEIDPAPIITDSERENFANGEVCDLVLALHGKILCSLDGEWPNLVEDRFARNMVDEPGYPEVESARFAQDGGDGIFYCGNYYTSDCVGTSPCGGFYCNYESDDFHILTWAEGTSDGGYAQLETTFEFNPGEEYPTYGIYFVENGGMFEAYIAFGDGIDSETAEPCDLSRLDDLDSLVVRWHDLALRIIRQSYPDFAEFR